MVEKKGGFQVTINILFVILCIFCLFPFLLLISSSFTDENILIKYGYSFFPRKFSAAAYTYLLKNGWKILSSYFNTIWVTILGTLLSLLITTLFAYPLSRRELPHRNGLSFFVFFTMLFNGGVVATYIMYTQYLHIKNTYASLIVPNLLMSAFYVMMMRTFFSQNIPDEILEAARIDGAGEWLTLRKIVLPLSKPIMATLGLLIGLNYWNDWINGLYFLTKDKYYTIQVLLNRMLSDMTFLTTSGSAASSNIKSSVLPTLGVKMAIAVIGVLPIMIAYPFFQKFLVKGITIGAVKG